ncbi:YceD family protein [Pseudonocardia spinosispora]|uniref:YceD family protein n=1 Tax=Pseudonocardia spinosispora TaxID=103441 RepID=UPI00040F83C4|nr:YceD family protein [Pseudonocardia spinosispora]
MTRQEQVNVHPSAASPWVISTRELGRRPGNMRTYQRTLQAPAGFGLDVIGIPENAPVTVDLRFESASEGVFVSGTAAAGVVGECARCLDPIEYPETVQLGELFAYPDTATEATTDADEISRIVDDYIDTEPMIRDAVLLALPLAPLCQEDCRGLCPECGERWAELSADHSHDTMDPRWAALRDRLTSAPDADAATGADERR